MPNLASIDIGTNTVRLLIAEALGSTAYRPLYMEQEITRLGEGFHKGEILDQGPMERTVRTLERFCRIAMDFQVQEIYAAATSAAREAKNKEEFRALVQERTGLELNVISGDEEARLSLLGVHASLGRPSGRLLLVDVGGGSTEFILARGSSPEVIRSAPLGVVELAEAYVLSDPPEARELEAVARIVRERLSEVRHALGNLEGVLLGGTAGTPTTLAAIDLKMMVYDPLKVNGHVLKRERVQEILSHLQSLTLEERKRLPGLEPGRADIIIPGTIILLEVLEGWGFPQITVSEGGLREGLLLDLLARRCGSK